MELVCTVLDDILQPYVMITIKVPKLVIIVKIGYHKAKHKFSRYAKFEDATNPAFS